jgi:hypothetical protein
MDGIDLASVTAFIAASSAAVCSPPPLAKSPDLGQRSAHCPHCRVQSRYDALGVDGAGTDRARGENQNEGRPGRPTNLLGLLKHEVGSQDVIAAGNYRRVPGVIPCDPDWNKFDSRPVFQCTRRSPNSARRYKPYDGPGAEYPTDDRS